MKTVIATVRPMSLTVMLSGLEMYMTMVLPDWSVRSVVAPVSEAGVVRPSKVVMFFVAIPESMNERSVDIDSLVMR